MTHIHVSKLTIIGSDNGLLPGRRQTIIWTNAGILLIESLRTKFSEILIEIYAFLIQENAFENIVWRMAATCLGVNVLILGFRLHPCQWQNILARLAGAFQIKRHIRNGLAADGSTLHWTAGYRFVNTVNLNM